MTHGSSGQMCTSKWPPGSGPVPGLYVRMGHRAILGVVLVMIIKMR